ncbi:MAG: ABC transporter substrate-binding protein [Dethiobacter sp.]|nr:ABC transporter substrate-binding protein [Dethiobacter sp.]
MKKKQIFIYLCVFAILAVVVLTAGCKQSKPPAVEAPVVYEFDAEVIIGFSGPLSGAGALYGQSCLDSLAMAADDANAAGGIVVDGKRYAFKVVGFDDEYRPDLSGTNARRLIDQYKVPVLFIPHAGGILAAMAFNQQEGVLIGAYTTFDLIVQRGNELIFRIPPPMATYHQPMAEWAFNTKGYRTVALLPSDSLYGVNWRNSFKDKWESMGGTVVYNADISYGAVDFYPHLTPAIAANPDVMLVIGPSEPSALMVRQARELGYKGGFVFGEQVKYDDMIPFIGMEPLYNSIGVGPPGRTPYVTEFGEWFPQEFLARYPKYPMVNNENQLHYEAFWVTVKAMEAAGTVTDAKAIRAAIPEVMPVKQLSSIRMTIAADGSFLGPATFITIDANSKFEEGTFTPFPAGYDEYFVDFRDVIPWTPRTEVAPWRLAFEKKYF